MGIVWFILRIVLNICLFTSNIWPFTSNIWILRQIFDFLCKYESNYTFFIVRFSLLFGLLFDLDRIVGQILPTDKYSYSILFVCICFYEYTNMNTTISIRFRKTNSSLIFDSGANRIVKSTIRPSLAGK